MMGHDIGLIAAEHEDPDENEALFTAAHWAHEALENSGVDLAVLSDVLQTVHTYTIGGGGQ